MVQVSLETLADFLLDGDPDDEKTSDRKSQRNRQERYHQCRSHPPLFHESTISFTTLVALYLRHEFVSDSMNGAEVNRVSRVGFEFLTKLENLVVDGAGRKVETHAPHIVQ